MAKLKESNQIEPKHRGSGSALNCFVMWLFGWVCVRPRRWFFGQMIRAAYPRWKIKKHEYFGWEFPNIHWWLLYVSVFRFFKWLNYEAWRPFCDWTDGRRRSYPLVARAIHRVGATTAGYAIAGGECFHCACIGGDPVDLSEDDTGATFILCGTESVGTQDGTDHRFWGNTICPNCGYMQDYSDSSL